MKSLGPFSLDRMMNAVERVRDRLRRATATLENGGVLYAVVGGNAVAAWVARVDEAAVRNTQDVDILLRRDDLEQAKKSCWPPPGSSSGHVKGDRSVSRWPRCQSPRCRAYRFRRRKGAAEDDTLPRRTLPNPSAEQNVNSACSRSNRWKVRMKLTSYRLERSSPFAGLWSASDSIDETSAEPAFRQPLAGCRKKCSIIQRRRGSPAFRRQCACHATMNDGGLKRGTQHSRTNTGSSRAYTGLRSECRGSRLGLGSRS